MPTIGVDLDGVVGDFTRQLGLYIGANGVHGDFGRHFPPPSSWGFSNWNLVADFEYYYEKFIQAGYYRTMPMIEGAVATLGMIRDLGWDIHIITNRGTSKRQLERNHKAIEDTLHWLRQNEVPHDLVSFIKDKTKICCDVIVEDAPHHIEKFNAKRYESNITPRVCCFGQPYNRHLVNAASTYCYDWNDVLAKVERVDQVLREEGIEDGQDRLSR